MFWNRLKQSDKIIDCVVIFDLTNAVQGVVLDYILPPNCDCQSLKVIQDFLLPCNHRSTFSEEYMLIFTDINGRLEFFACLLLPMSGYIVCVGSSQPYFELLHSLLALINRFHLYSQELRPNLNKFFSKLRIKNKLFSLDVSPGDPLSKFVLPIPSPNAFHFYHRYILEYYNTLSINNWIVVMECLLLEKSIVFHSDRLQRITSCILASLSLLYPLSWSHLIYPLLPSSCIDYVGCPIPFVAGVHSCLKETIKAHLTPNVRIVDLDNDMVYACEDSVTSLPPVLRQWLIKRCNQTQRTILKNVQSLRTNAAFNTASFLAEPFLELLAILLGGYRDSIRRMEPNSSFLYKSPETIGRQWDRSARFDEPNSNGWFFDRNLFIKSRGRDCQSYLKELIQSQMVLDFFESRVAILNSNLAMISSDEFEDMVDRVKVPSRFGLADFLKRRQNSFERLTRKLGINLRKQPDPLFTSVRNRSAPAADVHNATSSNLFRGFTESFQPGLHSNRSLSSDSLNDLDISDEVTKHVNTNAKQPELQLNNDKLVVKVEMSKRTQWEPLPPLADNENNQQQIIKLDHLRRNLLTSILSDLSERDLSLHHPHLFSNQNTAPQFFDRQNWCSFQSDYDGQQLSTPRLDNADLAELDPLCPIDICKAKPPQKTQKMDANQNDLIDFDPLSPLQLKRH